ncbi:MAG: hypothetical protein IGS03_05750 [Candidatus Sericytochromatia bacterium]|nr:hypothetical protein [Candidatus Sericytochromatia bacterium]
MVLKQAADHSQLAGAAIKKGLVPAAGLGVAAVGAAMVHDALTSDKERSGSEKALRGAAGTAMVLAGVETAGRAYGVSPLTAGAKALANVVPKQALIATAAAAPGLAATAWGMADIKENGVDLGNAAAVGLGSTQAAFYGVAIGTENASKTVHTLGSKTVGLVAAGGLGLGAYALGKEALENLKDDNLTKAGLYGGGAAVLGLSSAHVLAKTLGAPGLEKVAELVLRKPLLTASVAVLGVTAGAYALYNKDK